MFIGRSCLFIGWSCLLIGWQIRLIGWSYLFVGWRIRFIACMNGCFIQHHCIFQHDIGGYKTLIDFHQAVCCFWATTGLWFKWKGSFRNMPCVVSNLNKYSAWTARNHSQMPARLPLVTYLVSWSPSSLPYTILQNQLHVSDLFKIRTLSDNKAIRSLFVNPRFNFSNLSLTRATLFLDI